MLKSARAIAVGVALMSAATLAACSTTRTLNTAEVQTAIAKGLSEQVGGTFEVTCPANVPAEKGGTFTCQTKDPSDGATVTLTVTQDDDQGKFSWKVTAAGSRGPSPAASASAS